MSRGEVVKCMSDCATNYIRELWTRGSETEAGATPHGIISAGGSGGTSLAAAAMRNAIPIGVPKSIVSTVASGDTGAVIGETEITMMYSVVDIAGNNELLRKILSNAAGAIVGMAAAYERRLALSACKRDALIARTRVGVTMFGVTTPCVDKVREHLETQYDVEVFVFHATGHGGRAMERLVAQGQLDAIIDITTTEICDHLMGGNMSAGGTRVETTLKAGIPTVISSGATDMVNFGPLDTIPEAYKGRKLFEHNPSVTLMRTTKEECQQVGQFIVAQIRHCSRSPDRVQIRLPKGGVSSMAVPGGAFADAGADEELRETVKRGLLGTKVKVVEDERDINDSGFAIAAADSLMHMIMRGNKHGP